MWTTFAALVGGAAAGLTGLIFIVVSFRIEIITTSDEYRNRAAQTLPLFVTAIVASALVVAPQPPRALRSELLVMAVGGGLVLARFDRAARRARTRKPSVPAMVGLAEMADHVMKTGEMTQVADAHILALALIGPDGPTGTFRDRDGELPW